MPDPSNSSVPPSQDEKTEVLPETAVQLVEMERLKTELAGAEERAKNHWDQYLRALADVDNVRKRAAKDLETARQYAVEKFAQELVGVKDSLELGIQNSAKADVNSLVEGQTATLRLLAKAFEKAQIEEINPEGQAFNPELHEAMMAQPSDAPPNTVLAVIQRGYQLNGRLLRPARVVVSAAKNYPPFDGGRDFSRLKQTTRAPERGPVGQYPKRVSGDFTWAR
jgi:molecular chaperone GrpE